MLTRKQEIACFELASVDLKAMSYEQLEDFADTHELWEDWKEREIEVEGHTIYVYTMMGKLGWLHKRISVEITLDAAEGVSPPRLRCDYFERYQSGRFYPSPKEEARYEAIVKALPYAFVGVVGVGLVSLAWYILLRP